MNHQLITPPASAELHSDNQQHQHPHNEKRDLAVFVKNASLLILSLWPNSHPLKAEQFEVFLKEILTRSRCPLNVLQVAMFYLFKLKKKINLSNHDNNHQHLQSPKKVFLTCLILAFKYTLDSNYKFATWSKMSGLSISELQVLERDILLDLNYQLNDVNRPGIFNAWVLYLGHLATGATTETAIGCKRVAVAIDEVSISSKRVRVV